MVARSAFQARAAHCAVVCALATGALAVVIGCTAAAWMWSGVTTALFVFVAVVPLCPVIPLVGHFVLHQRAAEAERLGAQRPHEISYRSRPPG